MDSIFSLTSYPRFEDNQVLTKAHLNNMVDYLDQQNRLTRVATLGMGIVTGLEIANTSDNNLLIKQGCGLSSDGFILYVENDRVYNRFVEITVAQIEQLLAIDTNVLSLEEEVDGPIFELFLDADAPNFDTPTLAETGNYEDKVVLFLLDCDDIRNDLCIDDCDEKGVNRTFRHRVFLFHKDTAEKIISNNYGREGDINEYFAKKFDLEKIAIPRLGKLQPDQDGNFTANITGIVEYDNFQNYYKSIVTDLINNINLVLPHIPSLLQNVHVYRGDSLSLEVDLLENRVELDTLHRYEIQYYYDYLCDVAEACNELIEFGLDLVAATPSRIHLFEKHLWLGQPNLAAQNRIFNYIRPILNIFRTPYVQPPIYNSNASSLKETMALYARLKKLTEATAGTYQTPSFNNIIDSSNINITPSASPDQAIGERTIPFYYTQDLYEIWNAKLSRLGKAHRQYANPPILTSGNPPFDDPLVYSFADKKLFEG